MSDESELFAEAMADETPTPVDQPDQSVERTTADAEPEKQADRGRDERGRFSKVEPAEQAAKAPAAEQPATPAQAQTPADAGKQSDQVADIPSWRLREVTQERNDARQREAAANEANQRLMAQLQSLQDHISRNQPQQPVPDIFENPSAAVAHAMQPQLQQIRNALMHNSQLVASQIHGADAVSEADKAFSDAVAMRIIDPADYHRVLNSPNIYDAAVRWHKQQGIRQKIGDDLDGFLKKRDEELLNDQAFMAKVAEKLRSQANGGVAPARSSAPVVKLPPSLNKATSAAPAADDGEDLSDGALLKQALRR